MTVKRGCVLLRMAFTGAVLILSSALSAEPTDLSVKAAFLPRFIRYVSWPVSAMPQGSAPFVLCVIGGDPFGPLLDDAVRSQSVDGRRVVVRRMDAAGAIDACHVVFVEGSRMAATMAAVGNKPILTVTDERRGAQHGIINFTVISGRVRFFIDQASANQRGMQLSSRLLALAAGVRQ